MANPKIRTYAEKLLEDKDFNTAFQLEYENLVISEKAAELRQNNLGTRTKCHD